MLVYVRQLQDKLGHLISCWAIKESSAGLKKYSASYYSQTSKIGLFFSKMLVKNIMNDLKNKVILSVSQLSKELKKKRKCQV